MKRAVKPYGRLKTKEGVDLLVRLCSHQDRSRPTTMRYLISTSTSSWLTSGRPPVLHADTTRPDLLPSATHHAHPPSGQPLSRLDHVPHRGRRRASPAYGRRSMRGKLCEADDGSWRRAGKVWRLVGSRGGKIEAKAERGVCRQQHDVSSLAGGRGSTGRRS